MGKALILGRSGGTGVDECEQISELTGVFGSSVQGWVQLNWVVPSDEKIKGVVIRYKTGSYPASPTDGSVFYDSNDGAIPTTATKILTEGTTYYFRAFAYTYQNATRIYTTTTAGAQIYGLPYRVQGSMTITTSQVITIPAGANFIDIFCAGAGGGGSTYKCGGGGGYTATKKGQAVTPGEQVAVTIGAGGANNGGAGGSTSFGSYLTANGGGGGANGWGSSYRGGPGGSGGGGGNDVNGIDYRGGNGGSDGSAGGWPNGAGSNGQLGGVGQGTTTRAYGEAGGTLYSGGGGGSSGGAGGAGGGGQAHSFTGATATSGGANTGGGGGGAYQVTPGYGGSGICLIRWGY